MGDEIISAGAVTPSTHPPASTQGWTILASTGTLALASSSQEFAVYNDKSVFGRWPLTPEGERYARETYQAHLQSTAHGIAYSATGYQDPERLGLPTEPIVKSQTYASPMSYVGSTRRILAWAKKAADRNAGLKVLVWVTAVLAMLSMWSFLMFWYFVVFFLFGIFTFPFRLVRRGQRKNLHIQRQTLATQQAMYQQMVGMQQQPVMQQPPVGPPLQPPGAPQLPPQ